MDNKSSTLTSLESEQKLTQYFASLLIVCITSGALISLFKSSFDSWLQWNIIGHSITALILVFPTLIYLYVHFRRTVGIRKAGVLFSGLTASILLFGTLVSGLHIFIFGQTERLNWLPTLHSVLSYLTLTIVLIHGIGHFFSKKSSINKNKQRIFITFEKSTLVTSVLKVFLLYSVSVFTASFIYSWLYSPSSQPLPKNYDQTYGSHPFKPSLTETKSGGLIHVDQIAKSEQCGSCHTEIFEQWLSSTHRQAASDPTYVKNISLLVRKKGISAARYCEGCHAPVALLTGELTQGGTHGGIKGTLAHIDGVGCMSCHGIDQVLNTSGVASYRFSPKEHYLFDSTDSRLGQKIRNFLINSSPNKHKFAMGGHPISDPKLCATCHEQFMDKDMNDWGWVKMQGTYQEWLKSPFSGQANQPNSESEITRCQDCHFAPVMANDPSANKAGYVASHRSLGANTFLPILNGDTEQLELTKRFLQNSKLLIHIEEPEQKNRLSNKQSLENDLRTAGSELPYFLYLGDTGELSITVTNRLVGHSFPAGTTDLNQAWISLTVQDANGQVVYSSGSLNNKNELDSTAHIYHSTPVDRFGKPVWRHDLFRMTGESTKNVIESGRSDIKTYAFEVPSWAKTPLTVEAKLNYRKLNKKYAEWALDSKEVQIAVIEMARDELIIPLLQRRQAETIN